MKAILLERDQHLRALEEALHQAAVDAGQLVLVGGEAGIGKTSLVERFLAGCPVGTHALWGACDALFTPRPLGPLYDISRQTRIPLRALLQGDVSRAALFAAVLDELAHGPAPTIMVFEDIHWADEATLDLVKYLSRRIHRTRAQLILTYRDELAKDHPLRLVLGDLPAHDATRIRLSPLSKAAVTALAEQNGRAADPLYAITGGNPFFLTEMLASDTPGVPLSVSDAVLARIARLSTNARRLLELVAVVPNRIGWEVVENVSAEDSAALEECRLAGMLQADDTSLAYRHEIARRAVEDALSPERRRALHTKVLGALLDQGFEGFEQVSLARLVHHAVRAEDRALTLRFAPPAAEQASAHGAHREAAAHYATALRYEDHLSAEQRAEFLDRLSHEHYLTGQIERAVESCASALTIWRGLDRRDKVGHDLRLLSRFSWFLGDNAEAKRQGLAAIEALEALPPSRELAMAYGNLAHLGTRDHGSGDTMHWGGRAIELARSLDDYETECYVLNSMGIVELGIDDEDVLARGESRMERSLAIALEHGYEEHAARAYANLSIYYVGSHAFARAEGYLRDGLAYCAEHDLGPWEMFLRWVQARAHLDLGNWDQAADDAAAVLSMPWMSVTNRIPSLLVLGKVRARRGDPGTGAVLDEARDLTLATGELLRLEQLAAARAEWRWLQGDHVGSVQEAEAGYHPELQTSAGWYQGEVAIWLWRGGGLKVAPAGIPAPYALQIAGDWRAAAAEWERLACPYEQALALMDGDETAQRAALEIFERLGAAPAVAIVRRRLRSVGVRGLPRGPRPTTQANPFGLTNRQFDVLRLLAEGLRNSEIADRLSTTPKTVENHVSAVLAKLDARTRSDAVRIAYRHNLIPDAASLPPRKTGG